MSELPAGWAVARLEDLAELNPKQSFDDELVAGFVPMSHAPTNFRDKLRFDERPWGDIKKAYTNFKDGDVIFAKVTPCFENGKAAFVEGMPNGIGAGSSEFFVLQPSCDEVSAKYLLALVKSHDFLSKGAENMTGAVGLRRVPKQFVENYLVPVPPAAEQTRIAHKLDELLAQVDTLKARIDAIPAMLKRFRQSVLAAAVSGRLTDEWREKNGTGVWDKETLAGLSKRLHQGINTSADKVEYSETGTPILQAKHITSGEILIGDARNVGEDAYQKYQEKYCPPIGSILFTNIGTIGRSVVINKRPNFLIAWNIFLIEPNSLVAPKYLQINLEFLRVAGYYESLYRGGATQFVNKKQLSEINIPLPATDEQVEIVRRVEQLFAFADQLEAKVATAQSRIDRLTQSILAKAFRGELVPQDPNDEPASVLLERIQAQRAVAPKAKRGRKSA